jgi:hypothetical protein
MLNSMIAPAHFRFVIITPGGSRLVNEPDTYLLKQIIRQATERLGLVDAISYDKVWRGIRHDGAYSQVVPIGKLAGQNATAVGVIVFSYSAGYEVPLIPRPVPKPKPEPAAAPAVDETSQPREAASQSRERPAVGKEKLPEKVGGRKPRSKKAKKPDNK